MTTRPDREWIANKLELLMDHADDLVSIAPEVTNDYRPLTALKLIVLSAGVDVFSNIVPPQYEHSYYLDLFAGSGVTNLRGRDDSVVGSPILAPVMAHNDFREYHFVDNDSNSVSALRSRLDYMADVVDFPRDRCYVHEDDATDFTHKFLDDVREETGPSYKGANLFTFVDPEGLDLKWHATRRIANIYGDLLINFPKLGTNRSVGSSKARRFFGSNEYEYCRSQDARRRFYEKQLKSCDNKDITIPIRIDSGESGQHFHYDLIYATRETGGGSPYVPAMRSMKTKVEVLDGDHIDRVLDTVHGDAKALSEVFGPDEEEVANPEGQSTWERF